MKKEIDPMLIPKAITKMEKAIDHKRWKLYPDSDLHRHCLSFSQHRHDEPKRTARELEEKFNELLDFSIKEIEGREYVQACPIVFEQGEDFGDLITKYKTWNFLVQYWYCESNMEWNITVSVFYKFVAKPTFWNWLKNNILELAKKNNKNNLC